MIGNKSRLREPLILDFCLFNNTLSSLRIGSDTFINYNCRISCPKSTVLIGDLCNIGPNVSFETAGHWFNSKVGKRNSYQKPIMIGNNVWIGANVVILPGVTVGSNSIIAAGSVVTKDVEENDLYGEVHAKYIKELSEFIDEEIDI